MIRGKSIAATARECSAKLPDHWRKCESDQATHEFGPLGVVRVLELHVYTSKLNLI